MTVRRTKRGAERTSLDGTSADVLVCGASFAGLAVARELADSGADVLVVDRYEVGERATSACAAPTPWLHAMGVGDAIRQELPCMRFTTPHGSVRYRLPWSWSAFDYRHLCQLLDAQNDARFETAKVEHRTDDGVLTDRGHITSPLVVDALGWKRVLGDHFQPPEAPLSRGLERHPAHDASGDELHCWIDRGARAPRLRLARPGRARRPGSASARTTREGTSRRPRRARRPRGRALPGQLVPAPPAARRRHADVLRRRQRRPLLPAQRRGDPHRVLLRHRRGPRDPRRARRAPDRDDALRAYARFSEDHRPAFTRALRLQRLIPALPPRLLTAGLRAFHPFVDRAFTWYLAQADPGMATAWEQTQTHSRRAGKPSATVT